MLITYLSITLGALFLLGILISSMFGTQYIDDLETDMLREVEEINTIMVEKYNDSEKRQLAREELLTIARKYNACIQVTDLYGGSKTFSDPVDGSMWEPAADMDLTEKSAEVERNGATVMRNFFTGSAITQDVISVGKPLLNQGKVEGVIFFHMSMKSVNKAIAGVYSEVAISALIAVFVAAPIIYISARRFTNPLIRMNKTVQRYSKGDFDARVKITTQDELGQLAESFNAMASTLNDLEKLRKGFVANVSHELRSPLASMRGFVEALLDGTIPPDQREYYLGIVLEETNRLTTLVNDLLDLARIESGEVPLKLTVFDVNELLLRTLVTFEARIDQKHIDVKVDFIRQHCFVEADSDKISQVVRNLIDNAIKFTPEGGALSVLTDERNHLVFVSVADTGCGIKKEDLPYVFERFYKAEKAHTPGQPGTGLGLSIVKRIIDQHNQRIKVVSAETGTRFTFSLKPASEPRRRTVNHN
jgi:signal transduction histidine kinase